MTDRQAPREEGTARERAVVAPASSYWLRFVLRWGLAPILIGGGLLAALAQSALLRGAREASLRAGVTLGAGHLTIRPVQEGAAVRVIQDAGPIYTNTALMLLPGRTAGRLVLPVSVDSTGQSIVAELTGLESPEDPQLLLLAQNLSSGTWPKRGDARDASRTESGASGRAAHDVALGHGLAARLGVSVGDPLRIRWGAGPAQRTTAGRVAALVRTGLPRADEDRLWADADAVRELLTLPRAARAEAVTALAIYLDEPDRAVDWLTAVRRASLPPGIEILTWRQVDPSILPAEIWARASQRADRAGIATTAGGATASALLAVLLGLRGKAVPRWPRWGQRRAWSLAGPAPLGLTAGIVAYGALWACLNVRPLSAARVFGWLGAELNLYGNLTGPVSMSLPVERALPWLGVSAGAYAAVVLALSWILTQLGRI